MEIISDIENEFQQAYLGIKELPSASQLGVFTAYIYFCKLLQKIKLTPVAQLISKREDFLIRLKPVYGCNHTFSVKQGKSDSQASSLSCYHSTI